jgi:hypothetical protein
MFDTPPAAEVQHLRMLAIALAGPASPCRHQNLEALQIGQGDVQVQ